MEMCPRNKSWKNSGSLWSEVYANSSKQRSRIAWQLTCCQERQAGCINTWPMMQHLPGSGLQFPPAAYFPDFLDPPPRPPHRPLQMQWSDPVATRNVWSAGNPGQWEVLLAHFCMLSLDSMLVRPPDLLSKGCEFEFRQERRENFLL